MTHRSQLVKAGEELIEGHDQFLGSTLGSQAGEALDVSKQDAGRQEEEEWDKELTKTSWISWRHFLKGSAFLCDNSSLCQIDTQNQPAQGSFH